MSSSLLGSEAVQKVITKDSACPSMPVKYRIIGFIVCFIVGFALSILSGILFIFGMFAPYKFAILFTLGNICSILSSLFIVGPCGQIKNMFAKTRIIATILVLFFIVFTLVYALVIYKDKVGHKILLWIIIALQFAANIWYLLSYIPFGRTACKKCVACCCNMDN